MSCVLMWNVLNFTWNKTWNKNFEIININLKAWLENIIIWIEKLDSNMKRENIGIEILKLKYWLEVIATAW